MAPKQTRTFPFNFITMWIRPNEQEHVACGFCSKQPAEYIIHQYIAVTDVLVEGMDRVWMKAIRQQMDGNYSAPVYQLACPDCCMDQASIALGKRRAIQQLFSIAAMVKQSGTPCSQVIVCTVRSINDEGDLWAVNAPSTNIEDVVQHLKTVERR